MGMDRMGKKKVEGVKVGWQTFDHVADIGIRGVGKSCEEAFENGAKALFSLLVEDTSKISCTLDRHIQCESFDLTGLFVAWINSLIAKADIEEMVFWKFEVRIQELSLSATASGEKWQREKHGRGIEVKGATFTEAMVEKINGLWVAQCVVDV